MGFNTFPCNPYPISTEELNKGNNDDLNTRVTTLEGDVSDLNSNKANQITIAPFFNAETAYNAGDLVYYNGLSYRCVNDHEGEWDADDFAATTISGELDSLKSGLTNLITLSNVVITPQSTGVEYVFIDKPQSKSYSAIFLECTSPTGNSDDYLELWVQAVNASATQAVIRYKASTANLNYNVSVLWL